MISKRKNARILNLMKNLNIQDNNQHLQISKNVQKYFLRSLQGCWARGHKGSEAEAHKLRKNLLAPKIPVHSFKNW